MTGFPRLGARDQILGHLGIFFSFYYRDRLKFRYITLYTVSFAKKVRMLWLIPPTTQKVYTTQQPKK